MSRIRTPAIARLARRHALLQSQIGYLKGGSDVSNQDMRPALTKNEYAAFHAQFRAIRPSSRNLPSRIVAAIKRYEKLLRKADTLNNRAENARRPTPFVGLKLLRSRSCYEQSESVYEQALEILQELVSVCPGVASFFDRPVIFKMGDEPTLDPNSMPRLHTSLSPFALHMENNKRSPFYRLKLETLQASLAELYGGAREPSVRNVVCEELDINVSPSDADLVDPAMLDHDFL